MNLGISCFSCLIGGVSKQSPSRNLERRGFVQVGCENWAVSTLYEGVV